MRPADTSSRRSLTRPVRSSPTGRCVRFGRSPARSPSRVTCGTASAVPASRVGFGRGAQPAPLKAVPGPRLALAAAAVAAPAAQEVPLFTLQQLLHHQPGHRLHQRRNNVGLAARESGWAWPPVTFRSLTPFQYEVVCDDTA